MKENEKIEQFVVKYRERTIFFLRKHFTTLRSEDYEDIYQEASIVLFCKEAAGALKAVTCQLYTYFLRICINLSHKMVSRQQQAQEAEGRKARAAQARAAAQRIKSQMKVKVKQKKY